VSISADVLLLTIGTEKMTAKELEKRSGLSKTTVRSTLLQLREEKRIYRSGWERCPAGRSGGWAAVYSAGDKRDAKEPKRLPRAETDRRHAEKYKGLHKMRAMARNGELNPFAQLLFAAA
jgi:hypothetical protein